jgi:glutamate synthase (NADPH/NADH) small chain
VDVRALRRGHDAVLIATGATVWRELTLPGRRLTGIHQAMEYLVGANRVQAGDLAESPVSAHGRHVVIVGGGDTAADCLGTVVRQGAASVTQLDIYPQPGEARPEQEPWPTYPRIHRLSPAHEEAHDLGLAPEADTDARLFAAATLHFTGDAVGRVRELHLAAAEPGSRRALPGTERVLPADLVLLAIGFTGPETDGLVRQLGLAVDRRGTIARDRDFATALDGVFVAGDAGRGQSLVVWAIAEGRAAAASVDRLLTGSTTLPSPIRADDRPRVV